MVNNSSKHMPSIILTVVVFQQLQHFKNKSKPEKRCSYSARYKMYVQIGEKNIYNVNIQHTVGMDF